MTVATFEQPDYITDSQQPTKYKGNIDASIKVLSEISANFSPHEAATPNMTVLVDSGKVWSDTTYIAKAGQVTGTITVPSANPRIDRLAIDNTNGNLVVIAGSEAASPVAPDYAANHYPVCSFQLETTTSAITNAMIVDERPLVQASAGGGISETLIAQSVIKSAIYQQYTLAANPMNQWAIGHRNTTPADNILLGVGSSGYTHKAGPGYTNGVTELNAIGGAAVTRYSVIFIPSRDVFLVGSSGAVETTAIGGTATATITTNVPAGIIRDFSHNGASTETVVACSSSGAISYSTDGGVNWTAATTGSATDDYRFIIWTGTNFFTLDRNLAAKNVSSNGSTWTRAAGNPLTGAATAYCITYDSVHGHIIVGTDNGVYYSDDEGATFTHVDPSTPASPLVLAIASSNGVTIATDGSNDRIVYSDDGGVTWTTIDSPFRNAFNFYAYKGVFIASIQSILSGINNGYVLSSSIPVVP